MPRYDEYNSGYYGGHTVERDTLHGAYGNPYAHTGVVAYVEPTPITVAGPISQRAFNSGAPVTPWESTNGAGGGFSARTRGRVAYPQQIDPTAGTDLIERDRIHGRYGDPYARTGVFVPRPSGWDYPHAEAMAISGSASISAGDILTIGAIAAGLFFIAKEL